MPRSKQQPRHPLRRASDPGGDSFSSFRDTLKWLIPTCTALLLGILWLQRVIAEQVVNAHETVEQKELISKIDGVRNELSSKMSSQWALIYTKADALDRKAEIDRRLGLLDQVGADVTKRQMDMQAQLATQTAILETIKARQQDGRR